MFTTATIIASLAIVIFVLTNMAWFKRASRVTIPDNRLGFLGLWSLATLLGMASFFTAGTGWISVIFGGIATLGGVMLLSLHALRKQGAGDAIAVGDQIPVFSAVDGQGMTFESKSLTGSPVLLKFFRGHW